MSFEAFKNFTDIRRHYFTVDKEGRLIVQEGAKRGRTQVHWPQEAIQKVDSYFKQNLASLQTFLEDDKTPFPIEVERVLIQQLKDERVVRLFQMHLLQKLVPSELLFRIPKSHWSDLVEILKDANEDSAVKIVQSLDISEYRSVVELLDLASPQLLMALVEVPKETRLSLIPLLLTLSCEVLEEAHEHLGLILKLGPWFNLAESKEKNRLFELAISDPEIAEKLKSVGNQSREVKSRILLACLEIDSKEKRDQFLKDIIGKFSYFYLDLPLDLLPKLGDCFTDEDLNFLSRCYNNESNRHTGRRFIEAAIAHPESVPKLRFIETLSPVYQSQIILAWIAKGDPFLTNLPYIIRYFDLSTSFYETYDSVDVMSAVLSRLKEGEPHFNQLLYKAAKLKIDLDIVAQFPLPQTKEDYFFLESCLDVLSKLPPTIVQTIKIHFLRDLPELMRAKVKITEEWILMPHRLLMMNLPPLVQYDKTLCKALNDNPDLAKRFKPGYPYFNQLVVKGELTSIDQDIISQLPLPLSFREYAALESCFSLGEDFLKGLAEFAKNSPNVGIATLVDIFSDRPESSSQIQSIYPYVFQGLTPAYRDLLSSNIRKVMLQIKTANLPFYRMVQGNTPAQMDVLIKEMVRDPNLIHIVQFTHQMEQVCKDLPGLVRVYYKILLENRAEFREKVAENIQDLVTHFHGESFELALLEYAHFKLLPQWIPYLHLPERFFILKLLAKGFSQEQIKEILQDNKKVSQFEWAFQSLILLGLESKKCVEALHSLAPLLKGVSDLKKRAIPLLLLYLSNHPTFLDDFREAYPILDLPEDRLSQVLFENKDETDFVEALLNEQVLLAKLPELTVPILIETPFEYLPQKITVSKEHPLFKSRKLEEKKVAIKLIGVNAFSALKFFASRFKMELPDYFLLLYKRGPIPKHVSAHPGKSPPNFDLKSVLERLEFPETIKKNNQRLIDSVLAKSDPQWGAFHPETFEQIGQLAEWVYYYMISPDADRDNVRVILKSISDSVGNFCPSDWLNEFNFQYAELYGAEKPKDLVLTVAASGRLSLVNGVIQLLSKRMVSSGEAISFKKAFKYLSENHLRNRVVAWLKSRAVPGSDLMNTTTDPHLPRDLDVGRHFHPTKKEVVQIFDLLNTLPFLMGELDKALQKKSSLREWLEESPLASSYQEVEWQKAQAELLERPPPALEVKPTDLSPLFNANQTSVESVMELKSGGQATVGPIKEFLLSHQTFPEFAMSLRQYLRNPQDRANQAALQKAYNDYEKGLEQKRMRDQLRRQMIPCRLEDADITAYLAKKMTYAELVVRGVASAKKEAFANSLLDVNGRFKPEAYLIMLIESGLYVARGTNLS